MTPVQALGKLLFHDKRLSNPGSQFESSCASCHVPDNVNGEPRAYADVLPQSLLPSSSRGRKLTTARNTPTLLGVSQGDAFNWDGAYDSLDGLIAAKVVSPALGWLPSERERAVKEIQSAIQLDTGEMPGFEKAYAALFADAFGDDVGEMAADAVYGRVVEALSAYVGTLESDRTAAVDAWAYLNRINKSLTPGEDPKSFSGRLFGNLWNQEGRMVVKFPQGYDEETYQGLKIFYRVDPFLDNDQRVGNCVACHYPPNYTDFKFHNTGVTQEAYDKEHGEGAFLKLELGGERPVADGPDLGYYNVADPATAEGRGEDESEAEFLERMVGAFKTPTLRNIGKTDPYMHNGAYETLEAVVRQKMRTSAMAKAGTLRNADPAYLDMNLTEEAIAPLVKFLMTFDDVGKEAYRTLLLEGVETRTKRPEF